MACLLSGVPSASGGTYTYNSGVASDQNQWLNAAHWTGPTAAFPGKTNNPNSRGDSFGDLVGTDVAVMDAFSFDAGAGLAINFDASTRTGVTTNTGANGALGLGQVTFATTTAGKGALAIGNSSALPGILRLNGGNGGSTVVAVTGGYDLSLVNAIPGGSSTMDVMLGNTASVMQIADGRSLTVGSKLIERYDGSGLTLTGNQTGRLLLGGANTYTGQTRVAGGTLIVQKNGSIKKGVTIDPATATLKPTLAGDGTTGDVAVNGIITAGGGRGDTLTHDAVGLLTTGAQSWAGGGAYFCKISDTGTAPFAGGGTGWDKLVMNTLTLSAGGANGAFTIRVINDAIGPMSFAAGQQFQIAHLNTTFTVPADIASRLVLDTSGLNLTNTPFTYSFVPASGGGTDLMLTSVTSYTATPEPMTTLLEITGTSVLLTRRRRRFGTDRPGPKDQSGDAHTTKIGSTGCFRRGPVGPDRVNSIGP